LSATQRNAAVIALVSASLNPVSAFQFLFTSDGPPLTSAPPPQTTSVWFVPQAGSQANRQQLRAVERDRKHDAARCQQQCVLSSSNAEFSCMGFR